MGVSRIDVYTWGGFALVVSGAETASRTASLVTAGGLLLLFAGLEVFLRMRS